MSTSTKRSAFMWFATAVADFGDPFYAEERQRDVWNEASAFGFQLILWGGLTLGAAMLWIGGRDALPYAQALVGVIGLAAAMTIGYARRLGVEASGNWSRSRGRYLLLALVMGALLSGLLRATGSGDGLDGDLSTIAGAFVGAATVLVLVWLIGRRVLGRRSPDGDDEL